MAMNIIEAYRTTCMNLEGLEAHLMGAEVTLRRAHKIVMTGQMDRLTHVSLDRALVDYNYAVDDYNETLEAYNKVKAAKEQLERTIAKFSDVEQIVILLHVQQGMSLREIADKSNYSYQHLRNVSCMLRKEQIA